MANEETQRLSIEITSSGAKEAAKDLQEVAKAAEEASQKLERLKRKEAFHPDSTIQSRINSRFGLEGKGKMDGQAEAVWNMGLHRADPIAAYQNTATKQIVERSLVESKYKDQMSMFQPIYESGADKALETAYEAAEQARQELLMLRAQEAERQRLLDIETRSLQLKEQMQEEVRREKEEQKEAARAAREKQKEAQAQAREAKAQAREAARAAERELREAARAAERAAREEERRQREQAKEAERAAKEQAKAEAERAKAAEKSRIAIAKTVASLGKSAISGVGTGLKKLSAAVTEPIKKFNQFFESIKRIAFYRAIRTALKEITQGFSEGVKNLYQWSALNDGVFKASMDSLATSMLYLKDSIGAMVSPLINALAPAIDVVVDKFVDLINIINQALAMLMGQNFWYKATKSATEYAAAANGASKATKKQLMAFDELNNITTNSGSSSGKKNLDYGGLFTKETLDMASKSLAELINDAVDAIDAMDLGSKLGEKINEMVGKADKFLKGVKWTRLGKAFANFINDTVKKTDFALLGETIADMFNAKIQSALGLVWTLHWSEIGTKIGELIVNLVSKIDWENLASTINKIAKGVKTLVTSAFSYLKEHKKEIVDSMGEFFENLDWEGTLLLCSPLVLSGIKTMFISALTSSALTGTGVLTGSLGLAVTGCGEALAVGILGTMTAYLLINTIPAFQTIIETAKENIRNGWGGLMTAMGAQSAIMAAGFSEQMSYVLADIATAQAKVESLSTTITNKLTSQKVITLAVKIDSKAQELLDLMEKKGYVNPNTVTTVFGDAVHKANGGYVSQGTYFLAGEVAGEAEMVGNINGRTGVASGKEITGIAEAVYNTGADESKLLAEQNQLLRALLNKEVKIAPSAGLGQVMARSSMMYGRVTGA